MSSKPGSSEGEEAVLRDLKQQARRAPRLDDREEQKLLELSARGDRDSSSRLVAARLAMVVRLAESRRDQGLSVPDLVQEGSLGLVEAVQTFPGSGSADFGGYAEKKAGEQMDAAIAAEAAAVRDAEQLVTAANDYERTELLLRRTLKRAPTDAEVAEKLEWSVDRTRYVAQVVNDARRRHDEELLAFIDPDAVDFDGTIDGE